MKKLLLTFMLLSAICVSAQSDEAQPKEVPAYITEIVPKIIERQKELPPHISYYVYSTVYEGDTLPNKKGVTVSGRVVNEDNEGIANATVIVKGTQNRTSTTGDGFYSIKVTKGDTIAFFSLGMQLDFKVVEERPRINAKLKAGEVSREEIASLFGNMGQGMRGQGRMNRANAEGGDDARGDRPQRGEGFAGQRGARGQRGGANPNAQMQGQGRGQRQQPNAIPENILYIVDGREVADMSLIAPDMIEEIALQKNETITQTYGDRAAEGAMIIRTKNYDEAKIAKGDTKLYYVDGTEVDEASATAITKDRIEKKTELKGKTATTQYGSRAKKGVVLITTKGD